jgi:Putative Actinobacterial Holin-X, holin superfamily III
MLVAAAVLGLFVLGFGLAAGAAGIATVLPMWAALLIVTGALAGLTALLAVVGLGLIRKGAPPVPEQAIAEARKTTDALRSDGRD